MDGDKATDGSLTATDKHPSGWCRPASGWTLLPQRLPGPGESNLQAHTGNRLSRMLHSVARPAIKKDRYFGQLPKLKRGDSVVLEGQKHPCLRCRGATNRLARDNPSVNVLYTWPGNAGITSRGQARQPWRFWHKMI